MNRFFLQSILGGACLAIGASALMAQNRDFHAERIIIDDAASDGGFNSMTLQVPGTGLTADRTLTFPDADGNIVTLAAPLTANQILFGGPTGQAAQSANLIWDDGTGTFDIGAGNFTVDAATGDVASAGNIQADGTIQSGSSIIIDGTTPGTHSITATGGENLTISPTGGTLFINAPQLNHGSGVFVVNPGSMNFNSGLFTVDPGSISYNAGLLSVNPGTFSYASGLFSVTPATMEYTGSVFNMPGVLSVTPGPTLSLGTLLTVTPGGIDYNGSVFTVNPLGGVTATGAGSSFGDGTDAEQLQVEGVDGGAIEVDVNGDMDVSGTLTVGSLGLGFTQGSIPFADATGALAEDNAGLFWDNTNDRFGAGTNTPSAVIHGLSVDVAEPAIRGDNVASGVGVAGISDLYGVQGQTTTGTGVYAVATGSGTGLEGSSDLGTAASFSTTNAANANTVVSISNIGSGVSLTVGPGTGGDAIDVNGNILNGSGDVVVDDNLSVTGVLDAQAAANVVGDGTDAEQLQVDGVDGGAIEVDVNGDMDVSGNLSVGTLTLGGDLDMNDNNIINVTEVLGNSATGDLNINTTNAGDVNIGNGTGDVNVDANVIPTADDTYDLGSATLRWQDIYLGPATIHIGSNADEAEIGFTGGNLEFDANDDATSDLTIDGASGDVSVNTDLGVTGTATAGTLTDGAGTTITGGTVTASTVTDGTASMSGGTVSDGAGASMFGGTVTATTLTDGIASMSGGTVSDGFGASMFGGTVTAFTLTDGIASMSGGTISDGAGASMTGGTVTGSTVTDGVASMNAGTISDGAGASMSGGTVTGSTITDGTASMIAGTISDGAGVSISGGAIDATGAITGGSSITLGDDGAIPTAGTVVLHDNTATNTFTGTLQVADPLTANRTYTLPDADGTLALAGSIVTDATLTGDGTSGNPLGIDLTNSNTWTASQTFSGIVNTGTLDQQGNIASSTGSVTVNDNFVVTVGNFADFQGPIGSTTGDLQIGDAFFVNSGGSTDMRFDEQSIVRNSGADENIAIDNPGAGNISIQVNGAGVVTNSRLTINDGHWTSQQTTAPAGAAAGANVTSATLSNETDVAGFIDILTSGTPAAGAQATVTFDGAYATAPIVVLTAANGPGAGVGAYVTRTATTFTINFIGVPAATSNYQFFYQVIETQ